MCKMWNEMPDEILEGERIALAFLEPEDSEEYLYLVDSSRESLSEWFPWIEKFSTMADAYARIESYQVQREMGNGGALGIRRLDDGALIGEVIIQWMDKKNFAASLGYFLGSEFEGEGYATEALTLVLHYLQKWGMHRIEIAAAEKNEKSNALAKRLGFAFEGMAKDAEFLHGKFLNHNRYSFIFAGNE